MNIKIWYNWFVKKQSLVSLASVQHDLFTEVLLLLRNRGITSKISSIFFKQDQEEYDNPSEEIISLWRDYNNLIGWQILEAVLFIFFAIYHLLFSSISAISIGFILFGMLIIIINLYVYNKILKKRNRLICNIVNKILKEADN